MPGKKITDRKRAVFSFLKTAGASDAPFPSPADFPGALSVPGASSRAKQRGSSPRRHRPAPGFLTVVTILGAIPAGPEEPAEPTELGSIPVDLDALNIKRTSQTFALKVRGDSMIGAHIADGDLVIVEAREPKIGDIVAALIDGETTLKRFVSEDGKFFLQAENPKYPDLLPLVELTIQGVVRAVVRVCNRSGAAR